MSDIVNRQIIRFETSISDNLPVKYRKYQRIRTV
jgi:hypothetical protein